MNYKKKYFVQVEITNIQIQLLESMKESQEYCRGYWTFEDATGKNRKELKKEIKFLMDIGLVDYIRGCMTEDGEVSGSGFCRSYKGNEFIKEIHYLNKKSLNLTDNQLDEMRSL